MLDSSLLFQSLLNGIFMVIKATWWLWVILGLVLIGKITRGVVLKRRLAASRIEEIDKMSGETFERFMEVLFSELGYKVERTRYVGDYGADLVVQKDKVTTVIQVKRCKGKVNIKAVQEAVAAKAYYNCQKAMVVTNSYYTKAAVELAQANGVELWDRERLADTMFSIKDKGYAFRELDSATEIIKNVEDSKVCTVCGKIVSDKVLNYCLEHKELFKGQILCYTHQRLT